MIIKNAMAAGIIEGCSIRLPLCIWYSVIFVMEKVRPMPSSLPTVLPMASSISTSGSSQEMIVTISRLSPTPA